MKGSKFCKSESLVKSGKARGEQRCLCKGCGRHQIGRDAWVKYGDALRRMAVAMYLSSVGVRSIGRILQVPFQRVHV